MFFLSIRVTRARLIGFFVVCLLGTAVLVGFMPQAEEAVLSQSQSALQAQTEAQRLQLLAQWGLETGDAPLEFSEVIIPEDFDETYARYNELQQACGFDLQDYRGERVMRYSYEVLNLEGYGDVWVNLLVEEGTLIGGDIASVRLDGFMAGLQPLSELRASLQAGAAN